MALPADGPRRSVPMLPPKPVLAIPALTYTKALEDERAITAALFWHRAVAFFAAHDTTPICRVLTNNSTCYRSRTWAAVLAPKHKRTRPHTLRTSGKVADTPIAGFKLPSPWHLAAYEGTRNSSGCPGRFPLPSCCTSATAMSHRSIVSLWWCSRS